VEKLRPVKRRNGTCLAWMFQLRFGYRRIVVSETFSANRKVDPNFKAFSNWIQESHLA